MARGLVHHGEQVRTVARGLVRRGEQKPHRGEPILSPRCSSFNGPWRSNGGGMRIVGECACARIYASNGSLVGLSWFTLVHSHHRAQAKL